jgi:hypothetical protein
MKITFSIEKPSYMPFLREYLVDRQGSGEWYGEIKLNEHRCFIVMDEKGISIRGYKDPNVSLKMAPEAISDLKSMRIHPGTVFDGGYVKRSEIGEVRLWIFDVLMKDGRRVDLSCDERCDLRDSIITPTNHVWMPMRTEKWISEFDRMLKNPTALIRRNAMQCGISVEKFYPLVEGMVMKKKTSRLTFPRSVRSLPSSYFKLLRNRNRHQD